MPTRSAVVGLVLGLFLSTLQATSAFAGIVTWTFSAHVASVTQTNGALTNRSISIANGDAVTMTWSFDSVVSPTRHDEFSDSTGQFHNEFWDFGADPFGSGSLSASINGLVWSGPELYRATQGNLINDPNRGQYQSSGSFDSIARTHDLDSAFCSILSRCESETTGSLISPVGLNSVLGIQNHNYIAELGFSLSDSYRVLGEVTQFLVPGVPNSINLNPLRARSIRIVEQAERDRSCSIGPDGREVCTVGFLENYIITAVIDSIVMSVNEETAVPAPGALAVLLLGLIGVGVTRRTRATK